MANESFKEQVTASEILKQRWLAASDLAIAHVKNLYGIEIPREEAATLLSVRVATLGNTPVDHDDLLNEAAKLDVVVDHKQTQELKAALAKGEETAVASLPARPADRMSLVRNLGVDGGPKEPATLPMSASEQATKLRECLAVNSPAGRIALARKLQVGGLK